MVYKGKLSLLSSIIFNILYLFMKLLVEMITGLCCAAAMCARVCPSWSTMWHTACCTCAALSPVSRPVCLPVCPDPGSWTSQVSSSSRHRALPACTAMCTGVRPDWSSHHTEDTIYASCIMKANHTEQFTIEVFLDASLFNLQAPLAWVWCNGQLITR